jgi:inhibitor of KinA
VISFHSIEKALRRLLAQIHVPDEDNSRLVTIPVQYGGTFGPDLQFVAALLGKTPSEVVALHCGQAYRVLAIGFAPGFPYIGPVGAELSVARRATPRTAVPAGSVALAAGLTCVYPAQLPGGWHLIGKTTTQLFDPLNASPALLMAGDQIRFEPLDGGILP